MPEYSPCELESIRLEAEIERLIAKDLHAYRERAWLKSPSRKQPKVLRDPRGSKKGVKRGHYKKHYAC
jgi:hypothetical protein